MPRQVVIKARFQRAYDCLTVPEQERVRKALEGLESYLRTGQAPLGLGLKKLGPGVYEFRAGLALRVVYVEEGPLLVLVLLGSHDDVRRFLKQS